MRREHTVERSVEIAVPVADVYAFHLDTRNAALITPPPTRILGVTGEFPVAEGAVVTLRMRRRPLPLAMTWRVRIALLEPGRLIVDVAERSPFAAWRHEHRFRTLGPSRTLMTDVVTYRLPGGPLGRLANALLVRRQLERDFAERHARTRDLLERRAREPVAD